MATQTTALREWVAAEVETAEQYWRPMIEAAIKAAPHIEAVQNLRGILAAFDSVMPQARALLEDED